MCILLSDTTDDQAKSIPERLTDGDVNAEQHASLLHSHVRCKCAVSPGLNESFVLSCHTDSGIAVSPQ
ncbi:hypothetical protein F2P81_025074 [Scophthalmus maximus]|uniref:Uncharacterized protein n=1 Tax=Scophthalmus maximus TaxID=52904 RepID=A0A6A4RUG5_SCOMX|nr:hypothetical protein F2P81_025074 [Scophthalmus maximus]